MIDTGPAHRGDPSPSGRGGDRQESELQRQDRNLAELLQELRVASIGTQVLFGFLLSLPFTVRFTVLDAERRRLYVVALLLAALAIVLLSAPVAYHRMVFRQRKKAAVLRVGNALALAGLGAVGLAVSASVLLVVGVVLSGWIVPVIAFCTFGAFATMWFAVPLHARERPPPGM